MRNRDHDVDLVEARLIASRLTRMQAELHALAQKIGDGDDLSHDNEVAAGDARPRRADRDWDGAGTEEPAPAAR